MLASEGVTVELSVSLMDRLAPYMKGRRQTATSLVSRIVVEWINAREAEGRVIAANQLKNKASQLDTGQSIDWLIEQITLLSGGTLEDIRDVQQELKFVQFEYGYPTLRMAAMATYTHWLGVSAEPTALSE